MTNACQARLLRTSRKRSKGRGNKLEKPIYGRNGKLCLDHLKRFYSLLDVLEKRLGGARRLSECDGRMQWPKRGVYFFMEPGEDRTHSGDGPRVVRVGTHALKYGAKTTLWNRLSQHRGPARSGIGSQRNSLFRRLVGNALINKNSLDCPSWDKGSKVPPEVLERERFLEKTVSKVIGGMPFLWLAVEDKPRRNSMRGCIEQNAIALLNNWDNGFIDPPSCSWLGRHCDYEMVKASGLWNLDWIEEGCDPMFLDTLERLVDQVNGNLNPAPESR